MTGNGAVRPASGDGNVPVQRRDLRQLRSLLIGMMIGGLVGLVAGGIFLIRQEDTNERLENLLEVERRDDRFEIAQRCLDRWEGYRNFLDTAEQVAEAGARISVRTVAEMAEAEQTLLDQALVLVHELNAEEVRPIIEDHPPPDCDEAAAEAELAELERPAQE